MLADGLSDFSALICNAVFVFDDLFILQVLQSFQIMDYSLLVGIHNLDQALREKVGVPRHYLMVKA